MKQITIKNFKGIKEFSFNPQRINAFIGECGTGKTSVLEAITFCLTGKGDASMIRKGETSCYVKIVFNDGEILERRRDKSSTKVRINNEMTVKDVADKFVRSKGFNPDQLNSQKSGIWNQSIEEDNFSRFFFSVLPLSVKKGSLDKLVKEFIGEEPASKQMEYLKSLFVGKEDIDFTDMENAYKRAYQERSEQRKLWKEMSAKYHFAGNPPSFTKEEVEERINLYSKAEAAKELAAKQEATYLKAKQAHIRATDSLVLTKSKLEKYADVKKPDEEMYKKMQSDREKFVDAIKKCRGQVATLTANNDVFKRTLESLGKPVCPISEKLVCKTDKTALKDEMTSLIKRNDKSIAELHAFEEKCVRQIAMRDKMMKQYMDDLTKFREKTLLEKTIAGIVIPPMPEKPEKAPDYDPSLKAQAMKDLETLNRYETCMQFKKSLEETQEIIDCCDFAVEILNPKTGFYTMLIERAIMPLEDNCNKKAETLKKGMRIHIDNDDGIRLYVAPKEGDEYLPINKVSSGEFVIAVYLLMSTICSVTGNKAVMIDNADKLDAEALKNLLDIIREDKTMEYVFMASVNHEETEKILATTNMIKF